MPPSSFFFHFMPTPSANFSLPQSSTLTVQNPRWQPNKEMYKICLHCRLELQWNLLLVIPSPMGHTSVCLSVCPSIHPSIHTFIQLFVRLFIHASVHSIISPSVHPFSHPPIHQIHPSRNVLFLIYINYLCVTSSFRNSRSFNKHC